MYVNSASRSSPESLIQASAVGFYGPHGAEPVTEESCSGTGFLAEVCQAWEASTQPVEGLGVRRVIIRTGMCTFQGMKVHCNDYLYPSIYLQEVPWEVAGRGFHGFTL